MVGLKTMVSVAEKADAAPIAIDATRCLTVRNKNVACNRCATVCPTQALVVVPPEISINPDTCTRCFACTSICPTEALVAKKPTEGQLLDSARRALEQTAPLVVLACESWLSLRGGDINPAQVASIKCIAQINESLLFGLAARGAQTIVVATGNCADCAVCGPKEPAVDAARTARTALASFGIELEILRIGPDVIPEECINEESTNFDSSRRAMLTSMKGSLFVAAKDAAENVIEAKLPQKEPLSVYHQLRPRNEERTLPTFVPQRRVETLKALQSLGMPQDVLWNLPLWGYPQIDEVQCCDCKMCTMFCPTGALHVVQIEAAADEAAADATANDATARAVAAQHVGSALAFRTDLCLKCKTCTVVCLSKAIDYSEEVFAQDIVTGRVDILKELAPEDSDDTPTRTGRFCSVK